VAGLLEAHDEAKHRLVELGDAHLLALSEELLDIGHEIGVEELTQ
jgi:hypothetical protein